MTFLSNDLALAVVAEGRAIDDPYERLEFISYVHGLADQVTAETRTLLREQREQSGVGTV